MTGTEGGRVERWRVPPADVVLLVDAPPTPLLSIAPDGRTAAVLEYRVLPPLAQLAEPTLGLAGVRFWPRLHEWRRSWYFTGFRILGLQDGREERLAVPDGARLGRPVWAPAGGRFAFTRTTDDGVELWCADAGSGDVRRLVDARLNESFGSSLVWLPGGRELLVLLLDADRGRAPVPPPVPPGPLVEETAGRSAQNRTWSHLLQTAHDEALFEHHFRGRLARVDLDGGVTPLGVAAVFRSVEPAPDGRHLLVERVVPPYPHDVPLGRFAHVVEVWDGGGARVAEVAALPVADEVPIQGVALGPRAMGWQPLEPATLVWAEALDGGDPRRQVPERDRLVRLPAPFADPQEVLRVRQRFAGLDWIDVRGLALVTEWDRDRRWITTTRVDLADELAPAIVSDRSVDDRYGDPGSPVRRRRADGTSVARVDQGAIFLTGAGATPEGDRPFLDRLDLESLESRRVFQSGVERYTAFVQFVATERDGVPDFVVRRESPAEPPDYFILDAAGDEVRRLTRFPDPHPWVQEIRREVLHYRRQDGVQLSGTLYLPPGHVDGTRLPLVVWAYPHEYKDPATAGQVHAQPNRFVRLGGTSPLLFLTQGYAVLDGATMPVVGEPETVNDTFVEQVVGAARAAIDAAVERGVADRARVGIGGHSYGAFMAATLLAHADLFRAAIARSGAYNRTLTPFGFQSERRTLWEAREAYVRMSPYLYAAGIQAPILLIHGAEDDNPGTLPLQTQRLFHALAGLGGTARMVLLPHEGHGYAARESVLHVLAESFDWFDRHVKGAPAPGASS